MDVTDLLLCVTCPVLRPKGEPRRPNNPMVCDGCATQMATELSQVVDLYATVAGQLAPGQSAGERVGGTREPPLPLRVTPLDLTMPPRRLSLTAQARAHPDDQVGVLSVASELDFWAQDWRAARDMREVGPGPTVVEIVGWLSNRLDWAQRHYPVIDEYAADVHRLIRILRTATGMGALVHYLAAPCPTCDLVALVREDGADYVECRNCHRLWTEEEYRRLCVILAAESAVRESA